MLDEAEGVTVTGQTADASATIEECLRDHPDVLLMEAVGGESSCLELIRHLREKAGDTRVVMFTVSVTEDSAIRALRAGAYGVLTKDTPIEQLARALIGVSRGEAAISRSLTMRLIERFRAAPEGLSGMRPIRSELTAREWEVLDLVAAGSSTDEIARALVLTEDTVYSHLKSSMRKLGVHTRGDAVAAAERLRSQLAS